MPTSFFNHGINSILQQQEEISTIFVVGFPEDMQEREFQNMFIFCSGFEAAMLKVPEEDTTKKQIIGFAKFSTRKNAIDARDLLNGRVIDIDKGCLLKAEMAKKNLHTKKAIPLEFKSFFSSASTGLIRTMEEYHEPTMRFYPSVSTPPKLSFRTIDQNPPCNTLYVGNLPCGTDEKELALLFSHCPGYRRLSFKSKINGPMCFVEFEDTVYAAQALHELHGNPLSNSIKGGIRLSFSKNPLGVRQNSTMLIRR